MRGRSTSCAVLCTSLGHEPQKFNRGEDMHPDDEKILRLSKEIIIKFIELGRVSPGNFDENFKSIFWTLKSTLVNARVPELKDEPEPAGEGRSE